MLLALGSAALVHGAQDPSAAPEGAGPTAAGAEPSAVQGSPLSAKIIDVGGKVQWRPNAEAAWQAANVDDVVPPGAEVRTGLRSHAALRVGANATALLDAGTVFQLPVVVRDGEVLRTTVAVKSGRADFKVDKVGLTNDFKVVTPSTTLAVRGTTFAIATGPLKQVEVVGSRTNTIRAIELKYALSNTTVALSGSATSSSSVQQPAHSAVVATAAPVVAAAAPPATSAAETVVQASVGPSPAASGSAAQSQQANSTTAKAETTVTNTKPQTDGNSLLAVINRALVTKAEDLTAASDVRIADARDRVTAAIHAMLGNVEDDAQSGTHLAALEALRGLAAAKRDLARDALAQVAAARGAGSAGPVTLTDATLPEQIASFDAGAAGARDTADAIAATVGAEGDDESSVGEYEARVADAVGNEAAQLVAALRSMDSSLGEARLSIALVALMSAAHEGTEARDLLAAARGAVAEATQVVEDLAASRAAPQLVALAARARDQLAAMTADLAQALAARDAVVARLADAATDVDRARFTGLARLAENLLAARARLIGEWAGWNAALARRDAGTDTGADETGLGVAEGSFVQSLADGVGAAQVRMDSLGAVAEARAGLRADSAEAARDDAAGSVDLIAEEILAWEAGVVPESLALAADADERSEAADASLALAAATLGDAEGDGIAATGMEATARDASGSLAAAAGSGDAMDQAARAEALAAGASDLELLAESLVALRGHDDAVQEAIGDLAAQRAAVDDLRAAALAAVARMQAHAQDADGHASASEAHAAAANVASDAAAALLALAAELESVFGERYGFDASGIASSAESAADDAARARAASDAAAALRALAAALADQDLELADLEQVLAAIQDTLDGNEASGASSAALLARGRELVVDGLLEGSGAAGDLARDARDAALETSSAAEDLSGASADAVALRDATQAAAEAKSAEVDASAEGFDVQRAEFDAELAAGGVFAGQAADAQAALAALRDLLGQEQLVGAGEGDDERVALSETLRDALLLMQRSVERAEVSLESMQSARDAIAEVVDSLEPGEEATLASAIAAYESALASLDSAVAASEGHESVARAADEAVSRMEALLEGLGEADLPAALRAAAEEALASFRAEASTLTEVSGLLAEVAALRDGASLEDLAAWQASLDVVTSAMRAVAARTSAESSDAAGIRDDRAGELAGITSEAEDVLGDLALLLETEASAQRSLAEESADDAAGLRDGAVAPGAGTEFAIASGAPTPDELEQAAFGQATVLSEAADERFTELAVDGVRFFLKENAFDAAVGQADDRIEDALAAGATARLAEAMRLADALDGVESIVAGELGLEQLNSRVQATAADVRRYEALPGLVAQANAAIAALLEASQGIDGALAASTDAAELAAARADGLARIAAAVAELRAELGLSDAAFAQVDAALAAAAAHAGEAAAANAIAEAARADLAAVLARVIAADSEVGRVEALAAAIDARIAEGDEVSAGVAESFGLAREEYVRLNEDGAEAFAELAGRASADVVAIDDLVAGRVAIPIAELEEMRSLSGAYVVRLDGAESAAGRAEDARDRAFERRQLAEFHESATVTGLQQTIGALGLGASGLADASDHAVATLGSAESSRLASDAAAAFFLVAKDASIEASAHQAAALVIAPDLFKYGNSQAQFEASASARVGQVADRSAAESAAADAMLQGEVEFYDGIVNALDGRAGTDASAAAVAASGDARALATEAAARLRGYAQQAQEMADGAGTNAGRLFGRSMVQFVQRAQAAAGVAEVHASMAAAAATRAEANADTAISEVEAARIAAGSQGQ